jgi:hypothetical protein
MKGTFLARWGLVLLCLLPEAALAQAVAQWHPEVRLEFADELRYGPWQGELEAKRFLRLMERLETWPTWELSDDGSVKACLRRHPDLPRPSVYVYPSTSGFQCPRDSDPVDSDLGLKRRAVFAEGPVGTSLVFVDLVPRVFVEAAAGQVELAAGSELWKDLALFAGVAMEGWTGGAFLDELERTAEEARPGLFLIKEFLRGVDGPITALVGRDQRGRFIKLYPSANNRLIPEPTVLSLSPRFLQGSGLVLEQREPISWKDADPVVGRRDEYREGLLWIGQGSQEEEFLLAPGIWRLRPAAGDVHVNQCWARDRQGQGRWLIGMDDELCVCDESRRLVVRPTRQPPSRTLVNFESIDGRHYELVWDLALSSRLARSVVLRRGIWRVFLWSDYRVKPSAQGGQPELSPGWEALRMHFRGGTGAICLAEGAAAPTQDCVQAGDRVDIEPAPLRSLNEVRSSLGASEPGSGGLRSLGGELPSELIEALSILAEIAMNQARSKGFELLSERLRILTCEDLDASIMPPGLRQELAIGRDHGQLLPRTCQTLWSLRIEDMAIAGEGLYRALMLDLADLSLSTVVSRLDRKIQRLDGGPTYVSHFGPLVDELAEVVAGMIDGSKEPSHWSAQLLLVQMARAKWDLPWSTMPDHRKAPEVQAISCGLKLLFAAMAECYERGSCTALDISDIVDRPSEYFRMSRDTTCVAGMHLLARDWPDLEQFVSRGLDVVLPASDATSERLVASAIDFFFDLMERVVLLEVGARSMRAGLDMESVAELEMGDAEEELEHLQRVQLELSSLLAEATEGEVEMPPEMAACPVDGVAPATGELMWPEGEEPCSELEGDERTECLQTALRETSDAVEVAGAGLIEMRIRFAGLPAVRADEIPLPLEVYEPFATLLGEAWSTASGVLQNAEHELIALLSTEVENALETLDARVGEAREDDRRRVGGVPRLQAVTEVIGLAEAIERRIQQAQAAAMDPEADMALVELLAAVYELHMEWVHYPQMHDWHGDMSSSVDEALERLEVIDGLITALPPVVDDVHQVVRGALQRDPATSIVAAGVLLRAGYERRAASVLGFHELLEVCDGKTAPECRPALHELLRRHGATEEFSERQMEELRERWASACHYTDEAVDRLISTVEDTRKDRRREAAVVSALMKFSALLNTIVSYSSTYADDGVPAEQKREARQQAIDSLVRAATSRRHRDGEFVVSLGSTVGLDLAGAELLTDGGRLGVYYGQLALPMGVALQWLPDPYRLRSVHRATKHRFRSLRGIGVGAHLQLSVIDLGQYLAFSPNTSQGGIEVATPRLDNFFTIGLEAGVLIGTPSVPFVIGADLRFSPTLFGTGTAPGEGGGAVRAGILVGMYVPFFDFN